MTSLTRFAIHLTQKEQHYGAAFRSVPTTTPAEAHRVIKEQHLNNPSRRLPWRVHSGSPQSGTKPSRTTARECVRWAEEPPGAQVSA